MDDEKTTKEILKEKTAPRERMPLYSPEALERIKTDFDNWKNTVVPEQDRKNWEVTPYTILGSEIPRGMLYTPLDNADFDYENDLGNSGEEPFTRGIHPNMYRGRQFTIRQLCGGGSAKWQNKRMKMLLEHGATGINLLFDPPTIQMFDSDEPEAKGQEGTVGVPVDCVEDFEIIYDGIPIDEISSSIVSHYPRNTAILFPMYLVMAERRGISWDKLQGSVQNDFIMESLVRSACEYIPPKDDFKIQCDNIEFISKNVPKWNYITLNGYNLREWGTSGVTELAVAVANAIEIVKEMNKRGYDADFIGERLAFFLSPASDFFEEVARIRAVRRLWYKIMKYRFDAKNPRAMWMRTAMQTSGISLVREEPLNNIIRAAFHALSAVLGGAQSVHVDSYDEAFSVPSEEAAVVSVRTQQIIQAEAQVCQVVDPLGGSFYVEALTNDIEKRILDEVDEIERMCGIVEVVSNGWLHNKISRYIQHEQKMIDDGDIKIVGRNYFRNPDLKLPDIWVSEYDESIGKEQSAKLANLRMRRDNEKASSRLNALTEACKRGDNVMAACLDCARADCTVGEMRRAIVKAFGLWKSPIYV